MSDLLLESIAALKRLSRALASGPYPDQLLCGLRTQMHEEIDWERRQMKKSASFGGSSSSPSATNLETIPENEVQNVGVQDRMGQCKAGSRSAPSPNAPPPASTEELKRILHLRKQELRREAQALL